MHNSWIGVSPNQKYGPLSSSSSSYDTEMMRRTRSGLGMDPVDVAGANPQCVSGLLAFGFVVDTGNIKEAGNECRLRCPGLDSNGRSL